MVRIACRVIWLALVVGACGGHEARGAPSRATALCADSTCGSEGETCGAVDVANFADGDTETVRLGPFLVGERVRVMAYSFDRRPVSASVTVQSPDGRQLHVDGGLETGASQLEYTSLEPGCADFVVSRGSAQTERVVVSARRMM
jgi:hypothetical protein